jgi:hypothetical protein
MNLADAVIPAMRERENENHLRAHDCALLEKPYNLNELLAQVRTFLDPPSLSEDTR